jgi:DNA-binding response OmpR family regulator
VCEIRGCGAGGPWDPHLPTILLAPSSGGAGVVRALESGADDFLAAGAGEAETRARLHALLRRAAQRRGPSPTRVGELSIDPLARSCSLAGRPVALRRMEFELLAHLAREPDRVFTRGELLRAVWGFRAEGATRTVDSHACRLRRRLGPAGWVVNVRGVGYRLR